MKPFLPHFFAAAFAVVVFPASAATVYSWESGLDGWQADPAAAITTSTTGATDGSQALRITAPMSSMWYSVPASIDLDAAGRQAVFSGATTLTLDVSYADPGYNSWWSGPTLSLVIQGDGVAWTELGDRGITLNAAAQTLSWTVTPEQASALANGSWGQVLLLFKYGNGGSSSTDAIFNVDNFTSNAVPEPSSAALLASAALLTLCRRRA